MEFQQESRSFGLSNSDSVMGANDGMIEVKGLIQVVIIAESRHHDCGSCNVGLVRGTSYCAWHELHRPKSSRE